MAKVAQRIVTVLIYADIEAAHDFLVESFGFTAGGINRNAEGEVMHGEVSLEGGGNLAAPCFPGLRPTWGSGTRFGHRHAQRLRRGRRQALRTVHGRWRQNRVPACRPAVRPARIRRLRPRGPPMVFRHSHLNGSTGGAAPRDRKSTRL